MKRFKNILVAAAPGHLEPVTLRAAVELAEANDARLTVIDVVPPAPKWRRKMQVEGRVVDVDAMLAEDRGARLRKLVQNTRGGTDTAVVVTVGEPFLEVIRKVLAAGHDLVMVGEHEVAKGAHAEMGAGVMHLLRKCPCPVWVMRPSRARKLRILALVDPDPADPARNELCDFVLELATSLGEREDAELHVGHAWTMPGEATLRTSAYVRLPDSVVDAMVKSVFSTHRDELEKLLERHRVREVGATVHMEAGDPRIVLPKLAARLDSGLIVMGTVARTGLSGLIMGNTAETILRSVRCSVLAVKPEGFVTPVKPGRSR